MAIALYLSQFKVVMSALGSLFSSIQAFRAQRAGRSIRLLAYLGLGLALLLVTLWQFPDLVKN